MNELSAKQFALPDPSGMTGGPDATAPQQAGGQLISVVILRFLKRWRWLILGILAASILTGIVATLLATPLYSAITTLEIRRENFRITSAQGVEPDAQTYDLEFYQTQYGLLQTQSLFERVAQDMKIENDPNFFELFGIKKIADEIRSGGQAATSATARKQRLRLAGQILQGHASISPTRASRLVAIGFTSPDPAFSQRVANTWAKAFIDSTLERRFEATSYARKFLEERLEQLRQRLEQSERLLVSYAANQGIINLPTSAGAATNTTIDKPIVAENLEVLNRELSSAIADRVRAESRLKISGGATEETLASPTIAGLRARQAELSAEYAKMMTQFEPQYPPARALATQLAQINGAISREEGRVQSTLRGTYSSALTRESELQRRVQQLKSELLDVRGRSIQYNIYQRDVDTNRQLYEGLLQRYKEIGVAGGVGVNNIAVVDEADLPETPSSPKLIVNLLLALVAGSVIGLAIALMLEQIDEAVSNPQDVERTFGLPLLGIVPKSDEEDPRVELSDRKSPMVEAYLSAQTSLSFSTTHGVPKSMAVTSTRASEGKSTSSFALATSLARTGRRVVLVDGDMRSPSVHHMVDCKNVAGLSNYLAGSDDVKALVHADTGNKISVMTAGPPPPNAAELLSSDRLPKLLQELGEHFDHIILDIPPVMGLADAPLIARAVEGVVFVIQSHATGTSAARVAIRRLADSHSHILGVLMTKFQAQRAHYGYGYDYGYGYGSKKAEQS